MTLPEIALLVAAGFVSGALNAVAGGGTFITFGALTMVGLPAITANATSSIAQVPGYVTSALAYRRELGHRWRQALLLLVLSAIGALGGALLLLSLNNSSFRMIVPWLLLVATLLFAAGPRLRLGTSPDGSGSGRRSLSRIVQLAVAAYGGVFGAGMGIMMLASLGLTERGDYHQLNAVKNLLSIVIASVSIVVFTAGGIIDWLDALVMIPAVSIGGFVGVSIARQIPLKYLRLFVVLVGLLLAGYYFIGG
jgi:uncharacterized membrane protein YfcA